MRSRFLLTGALLLAASLYPAAGMASDRQAADWRSPDSSEEWSQDDQAPTDTGRSPAVEGTEQMGEIGTGSMPSEDPGRSSFGSGAGALAEETIEAGALKFRTGVDTGP